MNADATHLHGTCACGGVTVALAAMPALVNYCDCSACRRLGAAWVYLPRAHVTVTGETRAFTRTDMADAELAFRFCPTCGATILWEPLVREEGERIGINSRLFEEADFAGLETRFPAWRWWDGTGDPPPPRRAPGRMGDEVLP